jgi:HEPN domain-containing protein
MPPDPRLADGARAWFAKAASDLRAAERALTARPPLHADSAFHCQQAAEKAMKGFLPGTMCRFVAFTVSRRLASNACRSSRV